MDTGERVRKAEDHQIRAAILAALDGEEWSTRALVGQIPRPPFASDEGGLGQMAYHVAVLEQAGLVERVGGVWRLT